MIEVCSIEPSRKNGSAHNSETTEPILIKLAMLMDTICGRIILKHQDNQGTQRQDIALSLGSVRPKRKMPGID